jgi:hypothetical protein
MGLIGLEDRSNPTLAAPPQSYFRLAAHEIVLTGITAKYTFTRLSGVLLDALSQGISIRATMLDPSSPDLEWLREQEPVDLSQDKAMLDSGADIVEAGLPHSDPCWTARSSQAADDIALRGGVRIADVVATVREAYQATGKPICVGVGISDAAQAAEVAGFADGVIVASALVKAVLEAPDPAAGVAAVSGLTASLRKAVTGRAAAPTWPPTRNCR